jgi:hypothetical protein
MAGAGGVHNRGASLQLGDSAGKLTQQVSRRKISGEDLVRYCLACPQPLTKATKAEPQPPPLSASSPPPPCPFPPGWPRRQTNKANPVPIHPSLP